MDNSQETKSRTIVMPLELMEKVERIAEEQKRSANRQIELMLESYFEMKDTTKE